MPLGDTNRLWIHRAVSLKRTELQNERPWHFVQNACSECSQHWIHFLAGHCKHVELTNGMNEQAIVLFWWNATDKIVIAGRWLTYSRGVPCESKLFLCCLEIACNLGALLCIQRQWFMAKLRLAEIVVVFFQLCISRIFMELASTVYAVVAKFIYHCIDWSLCLYIVGCIGGWNLRHSVWCSWRFFSFDNSLHVTAVRAQECL